MASKDFGSRSIMSSSECEILQFLYEKKTPQHASDIMAHIVDLYRTERYNMPSPGTISSTMTRLQKRGVIKKMQVDRQIAYSPACTKAELLVDIAYEIGISMGLLRKDEKNVMREVKRALSKKTEEKLSPQYDPFDCPFPLEGEDS